MDADWSVEMGHDDPVLEFPWTSDDPNVSFRDLKTNLEALGDVPEANQHPPVREFLSALNRPASPFMTAKCDAWDESGAGVDHLGRICFACYVDVLFVDRHLQLSFEAHEQLVKDLSERVGGTDLDEGEAEFVVRRCFYYRTNSEHSDHRTDSDADAVKAADAEIGCSMTCFVRGYGADEHAAYATWSDGMRLVRDALLTSRVPRSFH